jgi:hypothetical protein
MLKCTSLTFTVFGTVLVQFFHDDINFFLQLISPLGD